jgi:adenine-specific DNA-methyltransferase
MQTEHVLPAWAVNFIEQDQEGLIAEHRVAVLARIGELAREGSWLEINDVICNVPVSDLTDGALMTLLRGTFRFKERLSGWDDLREQVEAHLDRRKANTPRLLMGL